MTNNNMPVIHIPAQKNMQYQKPSRGELFGNVWMTRNLDYDSNLGKIRVSPRIYKIFSEADSGGSAFTVCTSFIRTNADKTDRYWALAQTGANVSNQGVLFKATGTDPRTGWAQDAISNTPTDAADNMVIFGQANSYDRLMVARGTDVAMLNNGTWTNSWWVTTLSQSALSNSNPHYIYQFANLLLIPDGNNLHVVDDSGVVKVNRIVLPVQFQIIWIADDGDKVFIGTRNIRDGESYVFPWYATLSGTNTYERPKRVYSSISYAGCVLQGKLYVINGKGQFLEDNGVDFTEVASLPLSGTPYSWQDDISSGPMKLVNANGMKVIYQEKISILMSGAIDGDTSKVLPKRPRRNLGI